MQACPWTTCIEVTDLLIILLVFVSSGSVLRGCSSGKSFSMPLAPFSVLGGRATGLPTLFFVFARTPELSCLLTAATGS